MTYLVDQKRRVTLPQGVPPGASVEYQPDGENRWRLTVLQAPARTAPPVARRRFAKVADFRGVDLDAPAFNAW
jgi:hypothetical protein